MPRFCTLREEAVSLHPRPCTRTAALISPFHLPQQVAMFEKLVIIDCKGHLIGRLASIVAKELLRGQRIVLVRCEDINISGSFYRRAPPRLATRGPVRRCPWPGAAAAVVA